MKLPLHIAPGLSCSYLIDTDGHYIAKSVGDTSDSLRQFRALCEAANLSTELPAVQVNAKLLRACEIALEVIRRHDRGECEGPFEIIPQIPLESYVGEDHLTDPDGIQGIGDVLREAIAEAKSQFNIVP